MHRRLDPIVLCAVLLLGACRAPSVPELLGGLAPFNQLTGVRLGMRAGELRRARPDAQPEPRVGYAEWLGPLQVEYTVAGSRSDARVVPDGNRVEAVGSQAFYGSDGAARHAWGEVVQRIAATLGRPERCYRTQAPGPVETAEWRRDGATVRASVGDAHRGPGVAPRARIGPRVWVRVERKGLWRRLRARPGGAASPAETPVACPAAGG